MMYRFLLSVLSVVLLVLIVCLTNAYSAGRNDKATESRKGNVIKQWDVKPTVPKPLPTPQIDNEVDKIKKVDPISVLGNVADLEEVWIQKDVVPNAIDSVAFSPDNRNIAVLSIYGSLSVFNLEGDTKVELKKSFGTPGYSSFSCIGWSDNSHILISDNEYKDIIVIAYDDVFKKLSVVNTIDIELGSYDSDSSYILSRSFSKSGYLALSVFSNDNSIYIVSPSLTKKNLPAKLSGGDLPSYLGLDHSGHHLAISYHYYEDKSQYLRIIQLDGPDYKELKNIDLGKFKGDVSSIAWSPSGNEIAYGENNLTSGVNKIHVRNVLDLDKDTIVAVHPGALGNIHDISWSPDGRTIMASVGDNINSGHVELWDVLTKSEIQLTPHLKSTAGGVWSNDGQYIATGHISELTLWKVKYRSEEDTK